MTKKVNKQAETIQELFERRMTLVREISLLNAEQLLNSQKFSGNQIDIMRCSEALEKQPGSEQLRAELTEVEDRQEALQSTIDDYEDKLQALEEQVTALDRKLEAL